MSLQVGTSIEFRSFSQVTREQLRAYAEASGDFNAIHLDEEVARKAGLPGVIAHGMLTAGIMAERARSFHRVGGGRQRRARRVRVGVRNVSRIASQRRPADRSQSPDQLHPAGMSELRANRVQQMARASRAGGAHVRGASQGRRRRPRRRQGRDGRQAGPGNAGWESRSGQPRLARNG